MSDDNNKHPGDDEYQLPEDEYSVEHPEAKAEPEMSHDAVEPSHQPSWRDKVGDVSGAGVLDFLKTHKRAVGVIVFALLALIVFRLMTPTTKVVRKIKQPTAVSVSTPAVKTSSHPLSKQLNQLQESGVVNQASISNLQSQVTDLKTSVDQSTTNQAKLLQTLNTLTTQVGSLSKQVKADVTARIKLQRRALRGPRQVYHVRVIIPGRAWIVKKDGTTDSVTNGDFIQSYGVVTKIDPDKATVVTSSGRVIQSPVG